MAQDHTGQSNEEPDLNYFVCTLGQAAALNTRNPHQWRNINSFIDFKAQKSPDSHAVGFPVPPAGTDGDSEWGFLTYSGCC